MMKNSNVEWIGQIPDDWEVKRLKMVLQERNESNNPEKTNFILSLTNDRGVIPYDEKGDVGNKSKDDVTGYKLAYPNDIVLNSMNVVIGSVGISKYFGAVSPVYYMLFPRYENDDIRYYNYIFQTREFQNKLKGYGNGIMEIRMRIQMSKLNSVDIPVPNSLEQRKIADLLDKKCEQIDRLIEIQQQEIEKLKEYKTSVITQAVTKGLDPNVPMKDSGVEWIGQIPKNWEIDKLKRFYANRQEKFNGEDVEYFALENIESWTGKYIESDTLYDKSQSNMVYNGDTVFGKLRPYLAKTMYIDRKKCCSSEFAIFYNKHHLNNKYLHYIMLSDWFVNIVDSSTYGTKMPRANIDFINNVVIPYPSNEEQICICNHIEKQLCAINNLKEIKQRKIEKLQEYKKSLIYEYVTGKRRVI